MIQNTNLLTSFTRFEFIEQGHYHSENNLLTTLYMVRVHSEYRSSYSFLCSMSSFRKVITIEKTSLLNGFSMVQFFLKGCYHSENQFPYNSLHGGVHSAYCYIVRLHVMSSFWRATFTQNYDLITGFYMVQVQFEGLLLFRIPIFLLVSTWYEFILKGYDHSEYQYGYSFLHGRCSF